METATEIKKPTAHTEGGKNYWINESQAYDESGTGGDETTSADGGLATGDESPSIAFHTWESKVAPSYGSTLLKMKWSTNDATGNDQWHAEYTKNNGGAWADLLAKGTNRNVAIQTAQISLDADQDLTQVQVRISLDKVASGDGDTVYIWDIWTEGTVGAVTPQAVEGTLTLAGGLTTKPAKKVAGSITPSGALSAKVFKNLGGLSPHILNLAGALKKKVSKKGLVGTLTFVGDLATQFIAGMEYQSCDGTLTFTSALKRKIAKGLSGGLTFTGQVVKKVSKSFEGNVTFSGEVKKKTSKKGLAGALTFLGDVATRFRKTQAVSGILTFLGVLSAKAGKKLSGAVTFIGNLTRKVSKSFGGNVTFSGLLSRKTSKSPIGILTFAGALSTLYIPGAPGGKGKKIKTLSKPIFLVGP